jgi:hypothetical protein
MNFRAAGHKPAAASRHSCAGGWSALQPGEIDMSRATPIEGVRPLAGDELETVSGALNPMMLPLGVVAATMAALDMDEYWIPYFSQKVIEADQK